MRIFLVSGIRKHFPRMRKRDLTHLFPAHDSRELPHARLAVKRLDRGEGSIVMGLFGDV